MPRLGDKPAERESFTCPVCGLVSIERKSRRRKFCSKKCAGVATAKKYADARCHANCLLCGKPFEFIKSRSGEALYCGIKCSNRVKSWANSVVSGNRRRGIATGSGKSYIKEWGRHQHRVVMERHLGRRLKSNEIIHHIDGDKHNNVLSNLRLITRREHLWIHVHSKRKAKKKE